MADILEKITAYKLKEIADAVAKRPLAAVEEDAHKAPPVRGFAAALQARIAAGQPALIAEIKKAAPPRASSAPTSILPRSPRPTRRAARRACPCSPTAPPSRARPST